MAQKNNLHVAIFTLDSEKAFDKVLGPYLFKTLNKFCIHNSFQPSYKPMYEPNARVKVNGVISDSFNISIKRY